MTALGLVGLLLSFLAWRVAFVRGTETRVFVFVAIVLLHVASSIVYWMYAQNNPADANLYYYDTTRFYHYGFSYGTQSIVYLVQSLKALVGGTYLDYFLLFQSIGVWGIAFLMRTIEEIYAELRIEQPPSSYFVLFLPGLHFWTSAIGKDAPLFLACSLAVWAAIRMRRRYLAFATAVLIMMIIRPHIALIAIVALTLSTALNRRVSTLAQVSLLLLAIAGAALSALTLETALGVDVTSPESVATFLEAQSEIGARVSGGTAMVDASYPENLISLLFRPFFIDATGFMAIIVSFENLVIAYIIFTLVRYYGVSRLLMRDVFFLRFAITFAVVIALMLALVYYNVGLGLRQKMMFMPGLLTFFSGLVAVRRAAPGHAVLRPGKYVVAE